MRKKATRKQPYFTMESAMTAILRNASGKMHHGILFAPPLSSRCAYSSFHSCTTLSSLYIPLSVLPVVEISAAPQ